MQGRLRVCWRVRAGAAGGGAELGWRRPGGQRRTGGAGTAQARERLRSSSAGEIGSRAGGGAVESSGAAAAWSGEQAARERRRRSGVRARVQGRRFREEEETNV